MTTSFIVELIGSNGAPIGIMVNGYLFIPNAGGGFILQDSAGVNWLLTIKTNGALQSQQVTL